MKTYTNTGNKDTRSGFGAGLTELGKTNENVVALCADLIGSLKMDDFKKNHPERFFQVGIAEANMIGLAAGLTIGGKIPFTGTFANFSTGRVYDQIRQSVAYSDKNVKICASHAGLTLGEDGATHQILEDIGLMKISQSNTDLYLKRHKRNKKNLSKVLSSLTEKLELKKAINLIESYDISHFSGKKALAGQITYNRTGKVKDLYRTYNISKKNSGNDIGSMEEVIERRFSKKDRELILPSLILIDGSYTHLKAVRKVLDRLSVKGVSLLAISKGARRKPEMDLIHTETGKKLSLRKNSPEFLFIQEIRDEAHRFSISKQRKKELKGASKSSLDTIESVGIERKRALLRFFGSFDQISKASTKDLMKVRGVGKKTANIIFNNLH